MKNDINEYHEREDYAVNTILDEFEKPNNPIDKLINICYKYLKDNYRFNSKVFNNAIDEIFKYYNNDIDYAIFEIRSKLMNKNIRIQNNNKCIDNVVIYYKDNIIAIVPCIYGKYF